jgi:tyrosyl-tRNA synthetase
MRHVTQQDAYICSRCSFRASNLVKRSQRRSIGLKYQAKVAQAQKEWQAQAVKIRKGEQKSMLSILEERGLVHQITG